MWLLKYPMESVDGQNWKNVLSRAGVIGFEEISHCDKYTDSSSRSIFVGS